MQDEKTQTIYLIVMNLRVIKKDVDFLTQEFLSDAVISLNFAKEEKKKEKILNIINEVIAIRDETFAKINHPDSKNPKAFFHTLGEDFVKAIDAQYDKLSKAIK